MLSKFLISSKTKTLGKARQIHSQNALLKNRQGKQGNLGTYEKGSQQWAQYSGSTYSSMEPSKAFSEGTLDYSSSPGDSYSAKGDNQQVSSYDQGNNKSFSDQKQQQRTGGSWGSQDSQWPGKNEALKSDYRKDSGSYGDFDQKATLGGATSYQGQASKQSTNTQGSQYGDKKSSLREYGGSVVGGQYDQYNKTSGGKGSEWGSQYSQQRDIGHPNSQWAADRQTDIRTGGQYGTWKQGDTGSSTMGQGNRMNQWNKDQISQQSGWQSGSGMRDQQSGWQGNQSGYGSGQQSGWQGQGQQYGSGMKDQSGWQGSQSGYGSGQQGTRDWQGQGQQYGSGMKDQSGWQGSQSGYGSGQQSGMQGMRDQSGWQGQQYGSGMKDQSGWQGNQSGYGSGQQSGMRDQQSGWQGSQSGYGSGQQSGMKDQSGQQSGMKDQSGWQGSQSGYGSGQQSGMRDQQSGWQGMRDQSGWQGNQSGYGSGQQSGMRDQSGQQSGMQGMRDQQSGWQGMRDQQSGMQGMRDQQSGWQSGSGMKGRQSDSESGQKLGGSAGLNENDSSPYGVSS